MGRRLVAVLVASLLALSLGPAGAVAGGSPLVAAQETVDPDTVVLGVALQPDGDAAWTVEYRVRLATANETAAFEAFRAAVRANRSTYRDRFRDRMVRTARTAENATGRSMAIRNVSVTTSREALPQSAGVVTYRFTWTNFAATDGDRLRAGDAIAGLYLDRDTTLRVTWPEGYTARTVKPAPAARSDGEVRWEGPLGFGQSEPTVVVAPADDGPPLVFVAVGATVVLAALAGLWYYRRRGGRESTADEATPDDSDGPPSELLSNEERVIAVLEANDGRLKQGAIADELDWTAAKTSQVVGDMRDAGDVETFRLGRENVVTLPGVGLEADADEGSDDE